MQPGKFVWLRSEWRATTADHDSSASCQIWLYALCVWHDETVLNRIAYAQYSSASLRMTNRTSLYSVSSLCKFGPSPASPVQDKLNKSDILLPVLLPSSRQGVSPACAWVLSKVVLRACAGQRQR